LNYKDSFDGWFREVSEWIVVVNNDNTLKDLGTGNEGKTTRGGGIRASNRRRY
jgi:hypothetical protein